MFNGDTKATHLLHWLISAVLFLTGVRAMAENLPANVWTPALETRGGTISDITYLPEQKSLLYYGLPAPKATHSDLRLYHPDNRSWSEPLPGTGPHRQRGSLTTVFAPDQRPGLPTINRPYWLAHQSAYVPTMKKVLFFAGGATFTYDPATSRWEHLDIPLDKSPPDVMLGSMAWDPLGKRVILFGGGYISAHKKQADYIKGDMLKGKPWLADDWTPAEKRATWAFDPATKTWSKITTGSPTFRRQHDAAYALVARLETLAGSTRGIALEYGDRISHKSPEQLANDAAALADDFSAFARQLRDGDGFSDAYEHQQGQTAAQRLGGPIAALKSASQALRQGDGWKALHALESARRETEEAAEGIAPSPLPRYYGNLVTDTRNNLLVLFGGHGGDRVLADTWVFDPARNQWRQSRANGHPPPTATPAMSFDAEHGLVLLASGWLYDAAGDEWRRVPLDAPKDFFLPWTALDYDPARKTHVALTTGDNLFDPGILRVTHLRLDPRSAKPADNGGPRWEWLSDKYLKAWAALPKTQADYRRRVAAHRTVLDKLPANTWTRITAEYNAQDRSYGSFALDPARGQLVFWGGGHSAYMGNEVSQYDIKGNLWMESWPPDFPPWPFGAPDGDGWNPPLYHRKGSAHGYHKYAYSADLDKIVFFPHIYDPDRMRWGETTLQQTGSGTPGGPVDMSGAKEFYTVSAKHWYGAPFGVWKLNPANATLDRLHGSDTPFFTNDRAKAVFDSKRNRILFYGTRDKADNSPANQFYAFDIANATWAKQPITLEPPATETPVSTAWGIAYSPKHDSVLILPSGQKQETWLLDGGTNTLRRIGPGPKTQNQGTNGVVYSGNDDLFIAMEVGSYGTGPVAVHMLRLGKLSELGAL